MNEHVNNVNIIRYLQSARVNIWEKSGLYKSYKETHRGPMLVSSKVDFKTEKTYKIPDDLRAVFQSYSSKRSEI